EDAIGRRPRGDLVHALRALEGDDAGEREVEAELERALGEGSVLAEAVDDAADVAGAFGGEDVERVLGRFARVDDDRLADLPREADEPREDGALHVARRVIVVVVESDLADGDDDRLAREDG